MPSRMSNKERIARLAAEKQAEDREKEEKKKTKAKAPKKPRASRSRTSATKSAGRLKAVWVVCDQSGSIVRTFPFSGQADAEKECKKLISDKGKLHFVKMDKVPME